MAASASRHEEATGYRRPFIWPSRSLRASWRRLCHGSLGGNQRGIRRIVLAHCNSYAENLALPHLRRPRGGWRRGSRRHLPLAKASASPAAFPSTCWLHSAAGGCLGWRVSGGRRGMRRSGWRLGSSAAGGLPAEAKILRRRLIAAFGGLIIIRKLSLGAGWPHRENGHSSAVAGRRPCGGITGWLGGGWLLACRR